MKLTDKELQELKQAVEMASQGNYVPLLIIAGVMVFCFTIIVVLLISMYKKDRSTSYDQYKDLTTLTMRLTESSIQNAQIIAVHEAEINHLKKQSA